VVGGITNWSQVSAGGSHSLGITESGVLYAWGNNNNGRLGDNTISNQSSPVTVVGGITNWSQVSAGSSHSLGLTDTGVLYAWGLNSSGELGDGTTISKSSPVTVAGGITNWSQIDASDNNNLAIAGGIAYAWGPNNSGQLGTNSTVARSSPVTVVGGITNWSQVSAGRSHSLGLTDTGVLYAWGSNFYGKLGDGTTNNRSSPVTVVGGLTNWSQVAASIDNSIAINISVKSFTQ
jgi:alpha-tubulin suppressor-like RCC1 family protein